MGSRSTSETETDEKVSKPTCGRRLVKHEGLITHGLESKEGDWPWLKKQEIDSPKGNFTVFVRFSGTLLFFT